MDAIENVTAMRDTAKLVWALYEGLLKEGFDRHQALTLTVAWVEGMTRGVAET